MSTTATAAATLSLHPRYAALVAVGARENEERAKRSEREAADAALRCEGVRRAAREVIDGTLFQFAEVPDPKGCDVVGVPLKIDGPDGVSVGSLVVQFEDRRGRGEWKLETLHPPFGIVCRGSNTVREHDWFPTLASALADLDARVAHADRCRGKMLAIELEGQDEAA